MSALNTIRFDAHEIRTSTRDGQEWFALTDVLEAMETSNRPADAKEGIREHLGEEFLAIVPIPTGGGVQKVTMISYPAVTYLVARSRTPTGRRLNRFLHTEVIPSLRHKGHYTMADSRLNQEMQVRSVNLDHLIHHVLRQRNGMTQRQLRLGRVVVDMAKSTGMPMPRSGRTCTPFFARLMIELSAMGSRDYFRKKEEALAWLESSLAESLPASEDSDSEDRADEDSD